MHTRHHAFLWCLPALLPTLVFAQAATVQVNANTVKRTVAATHFGVNTTIWDGQLATSQTQDLVREAGISLLRLPGGSTSDEYHWTTNTTRDNTWKWASGFDKSSSLLINTAAAGIVTLNYGSGTPEEAAAWVAYANYPAGTVGVGDVTLGTDSPTPGAGSVPARDWQSARYWANLRAATPLITDDGMNFLRIGRAAPLDIHLWEVGNENYGSWEFDLQSPAQGAVTYATRAKAYMQEIHAVDASAKVGVVVETGTQYNNWTSLVLGTPNSLGAKPDFAIYHRYEQGPGGESDATLLQAARTWPNDIADLRTQLNTAFGAGNAAGITIYVTENNSVYTDPGKQSLSLVNGLFLADSIANVLQTETEGFVWWDLRNGPPANNQGDKPGLYGWRTYGDYGILSSQATGGSSSNYETYPTYYAFKLLKFFARGGDSIVQASSDDNLLAVFAAKRGTTTNILVINKDPANARSANFTLTGVQASSTENYIYSYGKPNDDAARPAGTGCADITRAPFTFNSSTFSQSFPAYSMSVISLGSTQPALIAVDPMIVAQPAAGSVTAGAGATFTGGASGCPVPTYRWQRAPSGSTTFTDLADGGSYSGTGTATLTVSSTTTAMNGDQFRLAATVGAVVAQSNAATLTVAAAPVPPPTSPPPSGGGGGGGAIDAWLLAVLMGVILRRWRAADPAAQAVPLA